METSAQTHGFHGHALHGSSQQIALLLARPDFAPPLLTHLSVGNSNPLTSTLSLSQLAANLSGFPAVIADLAISNDNNLTTSVSQQAATTVGVSLTSVLSFQPSVLDSLMRLGSCEDYIRKCLLQELQTTCQETVENKMQ